MGRHGAEGPRARPRVPWAVISLVLVLFTAIGLGLWWTSLRSHTDPIDASPVDGYALVVSSPSCGGPGSDTVVDLIGRTPPVRATLNACGHTREQRLAVQYLSTDPSQVRMAGTSVAGWSNAGRWLPLAILAAGVLAIAATIVLLMDKRRSGRVIAAHRLSVSDLQRSTSEPGSELHPEHEPDQGAGGASRPAGFDPALNGDLFTHRPAGGP